METVREAREGYFKESGFNEATYSDRWVKLPLGPLKFYLPNIAARKKAVPLHDRGVRDRDWLRKILGRLDDQPSRHPDGRCAFSTGIGPGVRSGS